MKETVLFLEQHGYWLLVLSILGRQACLPIPANLILLAAGALAQAGKLSLPGILGLSVISFVLADLAWYKVGCQLGSRILEYVCSLSGDLKTCVGKAAGSYERHGANTLLFSKFVIGLDAVAVPMAAASGLTLSRFLAFDALGAMLWSTTHTMLGYLFAQQLDLVAAQMARSAWLLSIVMVSIAGFYVVRKLARRRRMQMR